MSEIKFPTPVDNPLNDRVFFLKQAAENYIRVLAGVPPIESDDVSLISVASFAKLLGVCSRTVKRRIAETRKVAAEREAEASNSEAA